MALLKKTKTKNDDTLTGQTIITKKDKANLQNCLAKMWIMRFNINKCKVVHVGNTNPSAVYFMNNVELSESEIERDVGP